MRYLGRAIPRREDSRLLRGKGQFITDLEPVGNIHHLAFVRSPYPHARILGVDLAEAAQAAGVVAVIGPDHARRSLRPFSVAVNAPVPYWPMAVDRARYVGEVVAMVVARDRYLAEDAAELVRVEYEPLDAVVDLEHAAGPGAALLHEQAATNVLSDRHLTFGDPGRAFETAHHRIGGTFRFPRYSSTPIECYAVVADWDHASAECTIWSNFHGPFVMQPLLAAALRLQPNRLRLIVPKDIGGSFGIKSGVYPYMALVALASQAAGVPVSWKADRWEDLVASQSGTSRITAAEVAVDVSGRMLGLRLNILEDVGAFIRPPEPATIYRVHGNLTGPYRIDHLDVRARAVVTNRPPTGLNRGFGGQQLYFVLERLVDLVAQELGLAPAEVRRRNFIPRTEMPYRTPTGGVYDSGDYPSLLEELLRRSAYADLVTERDKLRAAGRLVGIGMAVIVDPSGTNLGYISVAQTPGERARTLGKSGSTETATLSVDSSGGVLLQIATAAEGQGHETTAAQIVADELGVPIDAVRVETGVDTARQAWNLSSGSYSSRFAPITCSAVLRACAILRDRILGIAADMLDTVPADLELVDGHVRMTGTDQRLPLRRVAGIAHWDPGSVGDRADTVLHVTASYSSPLATSPREDDTVDSSICYGAVADLCLVELDAETFQARVLRYWTVHDSGFVLNPLLADGQVMGALAHGLGGALYEELAYGPEGTPLATTFMDYCCITSREMPTVEIAHVPSTTDFVPSRAKGIGEGNSMSAPVAVANAVSDALRPLGVTIDRLPLHGGLIWKLVQEAAK